MAHPEGVASLLDTDLYKLTMQAAVLEHFPDTEVSYRFYNRSPERALNADAFRWVQAQVHDLGSLRVTAEEIDFLRDTCPYLPPTYHAFLEGYQLNPGKEVVLQFDTDTRKLSIDVRGLWSQTILYEIPLLSLVSEAYFRCVDTDWTHDAQRDRAKRKAQRLVENGCVFSEFGSRRRRDYRTQDEVLQGLIEGARRAKENGGNGELAGTSNVHFAQKYKLKPIGTVAHEWFMGTAAVTGDYEHANSNALRKWRQTYGSELGIALTDTFGTTAFLNDFPPELAAGFSGLRQDSGSPERFCQLAASWYREHGIDPATKTIVFSDALDVDKAIHLRKIAQDNRIGASFGIGTCFTNDFVRASSVTAAARSDGGDADSNGDGGSAGDKTAGVKSPALNIVIKLASAAGKPAVKISDELHKNTGDADMVRRVKELLGYVERQS